MPGLLDGHEEMRDERQDRKGRDSSMVMGGQQAWILRPAVSSRIGKWQMGEWVEKEVLPGSGENKTTARDLEWVRPQSRAHPATRREHNNKSFRVLIPLVLSHRERCPKFPFTNCCPLSRRYSLPRWNIRIYSGFGRYRAHFGATARIAIEKGSASPIIYFPAELMHGSWNAASLGAHSAYCCP